MEDVDLARGMGLARTLCVDTDFFGVENFLALGLDKQGSTYFILIR